MANTETNELEWYYEHDESPVGPLERRAFKRLIDDGVIDDETLVWNESLEDWAPYAELKSDFEGGEVSHLRQERDAPPPAEASAHRVEAMEAAQLVVRGEVGEFSAPGQREFSGQSEGSQTTLIIAFSVFIVMAFTGLALALFFVRGPSEEIEAFHSPHVDEKAINKAVAKSIDKALVKAMDKATTKAVDDPVDDLVDKAVAEAKSAVTGLEVKPSPPKAEAKQTQPATRGPSNAPSAPQKLATGSACEFNFNCRSNKCVKGQCTEGNIGEPCKYGFHCKDRKCVKGRCIEGVYGDPCKYSFHCKNRKCVKGYALRATSATPANTASCKDRVRQGRCIEGVYGDPCKYVSTATEALQRQALRGIDSLRAYADARQRRVTAEAARRRTNIRSWPRASKVDARGRRRFEAMSRRAYLASTTKFST